MTEREKDKLFVLSKKFAAEIIESSKNIEMPLGIEVAKSTERNYLMALLTANAIKYQEKKGIKKPIIAELGMGTGINAFAAFLINKNAYYIGIEIDDDCIK